LRDRRKDGRKAPAEVTQDASSEAVEIYAQRVPKARVHHVYIAVLTREKNSCLPYLSGNPRKIHQLGCLALLLPLHM